MTNRQLTTRLLTAVWAVVLVAACSADFKSGETVCGAIEPRCPDGFSCASGKCFKNGEARPGAGGSNGVGGSGAGGALGAGGSPGAGGTPAAGGNPGAGGTPGAGGSPGAGGAAGGCPAGQKLCPALDDAPATCAPTAGVCSTLTKCGTKGSTGCASAGDLVQCTQFGTAQECQPLASTCDATMVEASNTCGKCAFRKCCALFAACVQVDCLNTKTMPQYQDLGACLVGFCDDVCK